MIVNIVGSLSAKKWVKCYVPDKSTKLAGMVGMGLRSNVFNSSKMAFHFFVFCATFSKWRLFALSRAVLSPLDNPPSGGNFTSLNFCDS